MKFFKHKKEYTISFQKKFHTDGNGHYTEVQTSCVVEVIMELQKKYDFELVEVNVRESSFTSHFTYRCYPEDKLRICMDFAKIMGEHIAELAF